MGDLMNQLHAGGPALIDFSPRWTNQLARLNAAPISVRSNVFRQLFGSPLQDGSIACSTPYPISDNLAIPSNGSQRGDMFRFIIKYSEIVHSETVSEHQFRDLICWSGHKQGLPSSQVMTAYTDAVRSFYVPTEPAFWGRYQNFVNLLREIIADCQDGVAEEA